MTLLFKVTGKYLELVTKLSKKKVDPIDDICRECFNGPL